MINKLRIAIVGLGKWGNNLLRVLRQIQNVEVVAVCDSNPKARPAIDEIYFFTEFDVMLQWAHTDAIIIATPPGFHATHAVTALRAGKHVFVEKPMALSVDAAEEIREALADSELTFMVGHTFLYNDLVRWMKERIDSGGIGKILYATGAWLNWGTVRTDADAFWNFAPHPLSILIHLFGFPPQDIYRTGTAWLQPGIDDVSLVILKFGASVVDLALSWLSPVKMRQLFIVGEKASILFDDMSKELHIVEGDSTIRAYSTFGDFQLLRKAGQTLIPKIDYREPLLNEMEHFVDCCLTGEKPLTDFEHGFEVVRIMEQAKRL